MKVCFYSPVRDRAAFEYNQFYAQDLRALREIASEVVLATNWREVPRSVDVCFAWWWTWAFVPLSKMMPFGVPTVVTGVFDLDNPIEGFGFDSRPLWQQAAMRAALRYARSNVFVSRFEFDRVPARLATQAPCYAPLVVDAELHPYSSARAPEPFLLTICWLHAANARRKGVDLAIRAHAQLLAKHPELDLRIVGDQGDAVGELRQLAEQLGSAHRVNFVGRVDHAEKVELLQRCAVYLQPSVFEGFGVAAAEAMSCGAPVIATRGGTLPEVLGEDAFFLPTRDVPNLVAAIEEAMSARGSERTRRAADRVRSEYNFERRRAGLRDAIDMALARSN